LQITNINLSLKLSIVFKNYFTDIYLHFLLQQTQIQRNVYGAIRRNSKRTLSDCWEYSHHERIDAFCRLLSAQVDDRLVPVSPQVNLYTTLIQYWYNFLIISSYFSFQTLLKCSCTVALHKITTSTIPFYTIFRYFIAVFNYCIIFHFFLQFS
jgi:hypothetical protein